MNIENGAQYSPAELYGSAHANLPMPPDFVQAVDKFDPLYNQGIVPAYTPEGIEARANVVHRSLLPSLQEQFDRAAGALVDRETKGTYYSSGSPLKIPGINLLGEITSPKAAKAHDVTATKTVALTEE